MSLYPERKTIIAGMLLALHELGEERISQAVIPCFEKHLPDHQVKLLESGSDTRALKSIYISPKARRHPSGLIGPDQVLIGIASSERNWKSYVRERLEILNLV